MYQITLPLGLVATRAGVYYTTCKLLKDHVLVIALLTTLAEWMNNQRTLL